MKKIAKVAVGKSTSARPAPGLSERPRERAAEPGW